MTEGNERKRKSPTPKPTVRSELKSAVDHLDTATEAMTSQEDLILIHKTLMQFLKEVRL